MICCSFGPLPGILRYLNILDHVYLCCRCRVINLLIRIIMENICFIMNNYAISLLEQFFYVGSHSINL